MGKIVTDSQNYSDIADAIRAKGISGTFKPNEMADAIESISSGGITPSGSINITDTNPIDVTNYATAQVVDADLVAENIKQGVDILGVVGAFSGGGGITDFEVGFTYPASLTRLHIPYNTAKIPALVLCFSKDAWQADGQWSCGGIAFADITAYSTKQNKFAISITLGKHSTEKLEYNNIVAWATEQQAGCITFDRESTSNSWSENHKVDYIVVYDSDSTLHWRETL